VVNRGVAIWQGKVFVGTLDGRLIALNSVTGKQIWETLTIDPKFRYTITGAPRIVKGKVLIGNGGAEMGVRGYVSAYDADSGRMLWRFYTVPGDPSKPFESPELEKAAKTWSGDGRKFGVGGTVWDTIVYDADLDLIFLGVGNGTPWVRAKRSSHGGDNLFTCSIVALRPDSGAYVWHYQETPGD
jgi:quinohemoprotein ethanol dehydrogenase